MPGRGPLDEPQYSGAPSTAAEQAVVTDFDAFGDNAVVDPNKIDLVLILVDFVHDPQNGEPVVEESVEVAITSAISTNMPRT